MYYKGYGSKKMCHYCGGMHPTEKCPMMMWPPMMPPMGPPMGPPMMPPMMPPTPMPMPPMGGMMPGMEDMMMQHTQLLHHIAQKVDELYQMCLAMQTGNAKG